MSTNKPFTNSQRTRILKRAIDDMALLNLYNVTVAEKSQLKDWIEEFRTFDIDDMKDVIDLVFAQQNKSTDIACNKSIDYIRVPVIGSLRINKARQQILLATQEEGSISDEKVKEILDKYIAEKEALKVTPVVTTKINLKL